MAHRNEDLYRAMQEKRRSSAASPHEDRRTKRARTRQADKSRAIREGRAALEFCGGGIACALTGDERSVHEANRAVDESGRGSDVRNQDHRAIGSDRLQKVCQ